MKPSKSKAAMAARKRKSRQGKKELAERERQHAVAVDKLDVPERILIDQIVKANAARVKAEMPAKIQAAIDKAVVKNARKDALKGALDISDSLTTVRQDSDGKLVREPMRDRHGEILHDRTPAPPPPPPVSARPLTHAERVAPPFSGKPMNQWTMDELQARKEAHRAMYTPASARGSFDWFIRACAVRNSRV